MLKVLFLCRIKQDLYSITMFSILKRTALSVLAAGFTNCAAPKNSAEAGPKDFFINIPTSGSCPNPGASASVQDMLSGKMGADARAIADFMRCELEKPPAPAKK